jgi:hypothetical protein
VVTRGRAGRPAGIAALAVFFGAGAAISLASAVALVFPGSFLEPMWRLRPRARADFGSMGLRAPVLLALVCVACASAAAGLWSGRRWGHRLAAALIAINLIGDVANSVFGTEPRALIGVPIAALFLLFLATARVRAFFAAGGRKEP